MPRSVSLTLVSHPVQYDAMRRRLWILGQRCHHGATGAVLASGALLAATVSRSQLARTAVLAGATGALLMVHDWQDRYIWFERGRGSQP